MTLALFICIVFFSYITYLMGHYLGQNTQAQNLIFFYSSS